MISEEQARAVVKSMRNAWSGHTPAEVDTLLQWARQELSRRTPPDDGPITAELRSILQGLDELAELWGDEAKFRRMRDRLRAVVQRGEQSENPGQLPNFPTNRTAIQTTHVVDSPDHEQREPMVPAHVSRAQMNNIGPSR